MEYRNKSKIKEFVSLNVMLAVILMGLLTFENSSEAEIRIFTKPRFTILHDQLQIALEIYAYRLAMEHFLWVLKTLLNHPMLRNALLKKNTDGSRYIL